MDDIIMYNELKGAILSSLSSTQKWKLEEIKFDEDQSKIIEREKKLNAYVEYLAHTIVNLPMPD